MTLRTRLTLVAASVVAIVVSAASLTTYFVMRHELYSHLDSEIARHAALIQQRPSEAFAPNNFDQDIVQLVGTNTQSNGGPLPVDASIRRIATKEQGALFRNVEVQDHHLREVVAPLFQPVGGAVIVARLTDDIVRELGRLQLILLLVSLGGIAAAALAGALVSRATLAPVRRLTAAAESIAATGDPSERVPADWRGELGRLGSSFNTMLAALEESIETQRRFVADASHELRTPLTSLQTNIDVLRHGGELEPEARRRLLADLQRESQEMRTLIGGLLELARGESRQEKSAVHLDELVESALERARVRYPQLTWQAELEPTLVDGYGDRLERAVWNLLENAGKWSDDGAKVEVTLRGGELQVRDHGPGIAPADRPLVFDRFYRAEAARAMPGSGLGLAIVRDVAAAHGGTVVADEAPGGGTLMRLSLNGAAKS